MNERLQEWLLNALNAVGNTAGQAVDFLKGEFPEFVKEYILYAIVWNWSMSILGFIWLLILFSVFFVIIYKDIIKGILVHREGRGFPSLATFFVGMLLSIPGWAGIGHLDAAIQATWAPRVFLFNEAKQLVK